MKSELGGLAAASESELRASVVLSAQRAVNIAQAQAATGFENASISKKNGNTCTFSHK